MTDYIFEILKEVGETKTVEECCFTRWEQTNGKESEVLNHEK